MKPINIDRLKETTEVSWFTPVGIFGYVGTDRDYPALLRQAKGNPKRLAVFFASNAPVPKKLRGKTFVNPFDIFFTIAHLKIHLYGSNCEDTISRIERYWIELKEVP